MSIKNYIKSWLPKRNAFVVFLICFAFAAIFWLLKNLSSSFGHTIQIPITMVNYPSDWIVFGAEQEELNLNVRGRGFQLVQWDGLNVESFKVDLNLLQYPPKGERAFILTRQLIPTLQAYLGADLEWDGQLQDTLFFKVDQRVDRMTYVRFHGSMSAEKDSVQVNYELTPNRIHIQGPKRKLRDLDSISTIEAHFEMLHNDLSTKLALTVPGCDSCVLTPNQVELKIALEQLPSVE